MPASTARTTTASGVRRNLFHPHLSRRPTASTTSNSTSASTLLQTSFEESSGDIVVRDKNGNYQVEVPSMPGEQNEDPHEKEKIDARLVELFRDQSRRQPSEPAELLAAVQASLRSKAASLQEDNWMYEGEDEAGE